MKRFLLMLPAVFLLGCQQVEPPKQAVVNFTRFQPIHLDVAKIDIVEEYTSPMREPNVEHLISYSPAEAMRIWVKDRLRAVGTDKSAQVIIRDAGVIATPLPKPEGMQGFFTVSQDKRYDARLEVELRIYGDRAMSDANIAVTATRSVTIAENANVAEREATFRRMIFELMDMANAELEKNMYLYFGKYISYSHNP